MTTNHLVIHRSRKRLSVDGQISWMNYGGVGVEASMAGPHTRIAKQPNQECPERTGHSGRFRNGGTVGIVGSGLHPTFVVQ